MRQHISNNWAGKVGKSWDTLECSRLFEILGFPWLPVFFFTVFIYVKKKIYLSYEQRNPISWHYELTFSQNLEKPWNKMKTSATDWDSLLCKTTCMFQYSSTTNPSNHNSQKLKPFKNLTSPYNNPCIVKQIGNENKKSPLSNFGKLTFKLNKAISRDYKISFIQNISPFLTG